ncbi:antitoxin of toxin-antitoxin stability system [Sphingopyxis sp. CCNWLW253]|uniref:antitoxin of toxin-antitoxin stability system n=1 Tax=unclassified Sphingopyxis TaxID=2614943 RepID=UPI003012BB3F
MPAIIETTVFQIDELSDAAKERARGWYREAGFAYDWYDFVYDDFERVCEIMGIELHTVPVRLVGGGSRRKPCIWFSGFWSQGDGACFEGDYRYGKGASPAIRRFAPRDVELHRIADALGAIQRRNFYQLSARITHRGRYHHENSMAISVERDSPVVQDMTADAEEDVSEALRDLARWLYGRLDDEFEHLTSDDAVDEMIRVNG